MDKERSDCDDERRMRRAEAAVALPVRADMMAVMVSVVLCEDFDVVDVLLEQTSQDKSDDVKSQD